MSVAGYVGPAELTVARGLSSWRVDPVAVLCCVGLAAAYLAGVRGARHGGTAWPVGRVVSFLAGGLGVWLLATCSFLGVYQRVLVWPRLVQVIMLLAVTPVFLGLGAPVSLARSALAGRLGATASRLGARAWRVVSFPLVGTLLALGAQAVLLFTPLYQATMRHPAALAGTDVVLVAVGCLFTWPLLGVDVQGWYGYPARMLLALVDGLLDAVPGIIIMTGPSLVAARYFQALGRPWGPSPLADQHLGGAALVVLSELVGLPFLAALVVQWLRSEERHAVQLDRHLDLTAGRASAGADASVPADQTVPWWLTDGSRLGARRQQQLQATPPPSPDQPR